MGEVLKTIFIRILRFLKSDKTDEENCFLSGSVQPISLITLTLNKSLCITAAGITRRDFYPTNPPKNAN